jgi:ElaB/YqjD/DUF883 family membrane-anchored ribosome-binding protein
MLSIVTLLPRAGVSNAFAGPPEPLIRLQVGDNVVYLNPTIPLKKDQPAPFEGYLVEPERLEKAMIGVGESKDLRDNLKFAQKDLEIAQLKQLNAEKDRALEAARYESKLKEAKDKIDSLDVWYKKPWFVVAVTAAVFVLSGVLVP